MADSNYNQEPIESSMTVQDWVRLWTTKPGEQVTTSDNGEWLTYSSHILEILKDGNEVEASPHKPEQMSFSDFGAKLDTGELLLGQAYEVLEGRVGFIVESFEPEQSTHVVFKDNWSHQIWKKPAAE